MWWTNQAWWVEFLSGARGGGAEMMDGETHRGGGVARGGGGRKGHWRKRVKPMSAGAGSVNERDRKMNARAGLM